MLSQIASNVMQKQRETKREIAINCHRHRHYTTYCSVVHYVMRCHDDHGPERVQRLLALMA